MKTKATVTGPDSPVKLVFGIYGLKWFCKRLGCEPDIVSVLSAFQGGTKLEAMTEIIRSGMEQASVDANEGIVTPVSEHEACEILETATEKEAEKAMKAFFSSIVGEDYDEWFRKLLPDEPAPEAVASASGEEAPAEKKSEPGSKSSKKPTEKSA